MNTLKNIFGLLLMTTLIFTSCTKSDDGENPTFEAPSQEEFNALFEEALINNTQNFQFNAEDGWINLTSDNGVSIGINSSCLTLNGDPVTGTVDLEYIELFDKGSMLTTNKPTMGIMPNGDKALLISGGEFFIEATQNGTPLDISCDIQLGIPSELTGGIDNDMILWTGTIDEDGNLAWEEDERDGANGEGGIFFEGNLYYAFLDNFGWTNVDRFYNDPREKTTILVDAPEGYDNTNCNIYLSYDGEDNALAYLDTYDSNTGLFSEHYGQIPIGLECHVIFVTEENGNYKYAIKGVTIAENETITFTENETSVVTESQLVNIINNLP
ncbi:hypothetical protein BWZ22_08010 [Seonamhaeicola sp. S2-3]|uniref:hypothetical protein n=1 Tax=Seonamhaeicola sp. S2-3 TaxID=1936081 RepID=UPI000972663D|nr:hypothetical protein [Seonamhaeicola sp. S2-3]APY11191.1 hypothetical protein BWZ22_08010 [Seonamhaeicola sp. S2-3]